MRQITTSDRQNNFDLLRIISTIAVIFIHVNYLFFCKHSNTPTFDKVYIIESVINIITRFSVPAFVMISGGFNLNKENNANASEFYKKTSWKIFVPSFCAVLLFFVIDEIVAIFRGTRIIIPVIGIITGNYHNLWFLYMLVGLYLLTPLIIKIKQSVSEKFYVVSAFVLLIWAVGSQAVSSQRVAYALGVVFAFLGYYVMGDVILNNRIRLKYTKSVYFSIALIMFCVTFFVRYFGVSYYLFDAYKNFFSPTITIASLCIFAGVKKITIKYDLSWLSEKTYYVYLFHTIIYRMIYECIGDVKASFELIIIPVIVILTFAIALLLSVIYDRFWKSKKALENKWYSMRVWRIIK